MRMLREVARAASPSPPSLAPLTRLDSLSALPPTSAFRIWRDTNPPPTDAPWLSALVLVTFHLERGQVIEAVAPAAALSPTELDAVCFHAMPDSAAVGTGREDALYSFRIAREDGALLLCHTLFRQAPDPANPRGFFQKALVVVTATPCMQLHATMLVALANPAFVKGSEALQLAFEDVETWPDPFMQTALRVLKLPFAGETIHVSLPLSFLSSFAAPTATLGSAGVEKQSRNSDPLTPTSVTRGLSTDGAGAEDEDSSLSVAHAGAGVPLVVRQWPLTIPSSNNMAAPFHEVDLAMALRGVHDMLWTLWELVVLGEPLLVWGSTPPQVASAVLALVGLVHPLPFTGDWRPYYCIQDVTYADLFRAKKVESVFPNGAVYGVTNSHLVTTLKFSHILTLPATNGVGKARKAGLLTTHRGSLRKSRQLASMLSAAVSAAGSKDFKSLGRAADVRACIFEKITRPFLRAFDRYLVPTWGGGQLVTAEPYASDPFGRELGLVALDSKTFPTAEDLASPGVMTLFRSGAISRNRVRALYERFSAGPVFRTWWEGARAAAERECGMLHRTDLIEACVRGTGVVTTQLDKDDVDDARVVDTVVELCLRVQEEVRAAADDDYTLREKLSTFLDELGRRLPEEVRVSMRMPSMS